MTSPIDERYNTRSIPYIGNSFEPGKYSLTWEAEKDLLAQRTIEIK